MVDPTTKVESIREKLNQNKQKLLYSLDAKPKIATEYFTTEEVAFKKAGTEKVKISSSY